MSLKVSDSILDDGADDIDAEVDTDDGSGSNDPGNGAAAVVVVDEVGKVGDGADEGGGRVAADGDGADEGGGRVGGGAADGGGNGAPATAATEGAADAVMAGVATTGDATVIVNDVDGVGVSDTTNVGGTATVPIVPDDLEIPDDNSHIFWMNVMKTSSKAFRLAGFYVSSSSQSPVTR